MRSRLLMGAALAAAMLAGPVAAAPDAPAPAAAVKKAGPADAKLQAIYKAEWDWRMNEFPGERRGAGIHPKLGQVDPASQARRLAHWREVRKSLDAIAEKDLSGDEAVNYEVYKNQLDTLINQQRFREYEKPFNSDSQFWSDLGFTASRTFHDAQDYRAWIAQMNDVPRWFDDQTANMRAGLARGFTPPRATLVGRDKSVSNVSQASDAEHTLFWKPFEHMPQSVSPADQAALRAEAKRTIEGKVMPAYAKLLTFLDTEYIPHTTTVLAAEALPDGKAYYQAQIKEFTTTDMTPEEIHQLGLSEVAKIHAQMLEVM
ncbi:MAG: DUF885 domain-containing protein, partial [Phenylobacterium sp.]